MFVKMSIFCGCLDADGTMSKEDTKVQTAVSVSRLGVVTIATLKSWKLEDG